MLVEPPWWRAAVFYQIYPRSWADSNADGVGDLKGVTERLDYLEWLGIDAIWLNPIMPSPNADWGYDISDYCGVHPDLGSIDDLKRLVEEAADRGIRVLLDLVPNHTSNLHPWFVDSSSSKASRRRDWYVWADPKPNGSPPNNWASLLGGGPAWSLDPKTAQYYLHLFLPEQPDLNWWNPEVRDAFDHILEFWFNNGIAGFRIDVAHGLIHDEKLRDNPPIGPSDHPEISRHGQRLAYSMNRPEVHEILAHWRSLCERFDSPRILVGETYIFDLSEMARFYGTGADELNLAFNFPFVFSSLDPGTLSAIVENTEALFDGRHWPAWTASNHDVGRFATRWCRDDPDATRCVLMMLLTLRGTPFLYYGDEIGMTNARVPRQRLRDPAALAQWPMNTGRDPCRTPMPWSGGAGAGFTEPGVEPWLPFGDVGACNVEDQRTDRSSNLNLCRDMIMLRRQYRDLVDGDYRSLAAPEGVWGWMRGDQFSVFLNLSNASKACLAVTGRVAVGTHRDRDGELLSGRLDIDPWEGVIVRHGEPRSVIE
jgi:alpha-glucosidase